MKTFKKRSELSDVMIKEWLQTSYRPPAVPEEDWRYRVEGYKQRNGLDQVWMKELVLDTNFLSSVMPYKGNQELEALLDRNTRPKDTRVVITNEVFNEWIRSGWYKDDPDYTQEHIDLAWSCVDAIVDTEFQRGDKKVITDAMRKMMFTMKKKDEHTDMRLLMYGMDRARAGLETQYVTADKKINQIVRFLGRKPRSHYAQRLSTINHLIYLPDNVKLENTPGLTNEEREKIKPAA